MIPHSILANALAVAPLNNRADLNKALRGVTGVYALYCVVSGRYYIGSSTACIYKRVIDYTQPGYQAKISHYPLILAINKYGLDQFLVLLLTVTSPDEARAAEQVAIDLYKPTYNQLKLVGTFKGYKHSDVTKASITGAGNSFYGKTHSEAARERIAEAVGTALIVTDTSVEPHIVTRYRSHKAAATALSSTHITLASYARSGKLLRGIYRIEVIKGSVRLAGVVLVLYLLLSFHS